MLTFSFFWCVARSQIGIGSNCARVRHKMRHEDPGMGTVQCICICMALVWIRYGYGTVCVRVRTRDYVNAKVQEAIRMFW